MSAPRLERYEIIDELGQGGMSVVYRARDKQLSRDVALKVLHDFLARQTEARRRFHREAVAVAKLHHPGILEIFDYSGPHADQSYIVTELIEGKTLRQLVDDYGKPRFPELAALVVAELVRALRHAHEQGVVHRDLKPENIMLTNAGQLKLMDFGIAQIMGGATKLTATGTLLGSPAHMAPEVIDGQCSDHRSDIFSVGTILYWLTTGELPFSGPNPSALFRRILEGRYEPAQLIEPKIGNKLSRTIDRALARDPDDRYQDICELEADLAEELEEVGLAPFEVTVKSFLVSPTGFADDFEPKLVARLTERGEAALAEGHVARAMDRFNRVLAVEPHHEKVRALVARVGRRERLTRGARRAAAVTAASLLIGGVAYGAVRYYPELAASDEAPPSAAFLAARDAPIADRDDVARVAGRGPGGSIRGVERDGANDAAPPGGVPSGDLRRDGAPGDLGNGGARSGDLGNGARSGDLGNGARSGDVDNGGAPSQGGDNGDVRRGGAPGGVARADGAPGGVARADGARGASARGGAPGGARSAENDARRARDDRRARTDGAANRGASGDPDARRADRAGDAEGDPVPDRRRRGGDARRTPGAGAEGAMGAERAATEQVVSAALRIRIQHWAHVRIDGVLTKNVVNRQFALGVGEHDVQIVFPGIDEGARRVPAGRFATRRFVVDEDGGLFELRDGKRVRSPGTIDVRIPADATQAAATAGWTST